MDLVIVESPAKARTIKKYLGRGFIVESSYGHVRDLPKSTLGVDTKKNFTPTYEVPAKAKKVVAKLKKAAKAADAIYFAMDEDREGEAIAWHLIELLKPKKDVYRITFDEITKSAITNAVKHPRSINENLVDAQQARRVLDRLVGYELSPFLWDKVRRGLSAGRVQSVTLRLIVEREREVNAFTPQEYWSIEADLKCAHGTFTALVRTQDGKTIQKLGIGSKKDASAIVDALSGARWTVSGLQERTLHRSPPPPFTTSTLQQNASNVLGFSAKKTMLLAQRLYEGMDVGEDGPTGLITYMRTDSTNLAAEAIDGLRAHINKSLGADYLPPAPRVFKKKSKGAQEAHEAVRPTDPTRTPERMRGFLERDSFRLYDLIWRRTVSCQTQDATFHAMTVDVEATPKNAPPVFGFRATGSRVAFDGFLRVLAVKTKETLLPAIEKGETLTNTAVRPLQHMTQPPARYSEATLVKALEENGIGRPSTYAPTIDTIQRRGYVEKDEDRRFHPTDVGTVVTDLLIKHFPDIVDIQFTAKMETRLDDIARGEKKWQPVIKTFYTPFHKNIVQKAKEVKKKDIVEEKTDEICTECNASMVIKLGRYGKFLGCSTYPECKHTRPIPGGKEEQEQKDAPTGKKCPECGKGEMTLKHGRYGPFLGCSAYPDCKNIERIEKKTGAACPKCGNGDIIEKRSKRGRTFYACNQYPKCEFALWQKPTGETCPECKNLLVFAKGKQITCTNKSCNYSKAVEEE